jgi:sRNA-binding protein
VFSDPRDDPRSEVEPLISKEQRKMNPETIRGFEEARQQFEARARWPKAFLAKGHEVRPLQTRIRQSIAAEMGWSTAYTGGVLRIWTARPQYCRACLTYPTRIALDGSPTDELVDDDARAMARERLDELARRAAERKARESPPPAGAVEASAAGSGARARPACRGEDR